MDFGEFKKAFFAGDLIWLRGVSETGETLLLRELERMQVRPSCVEFTDMNGISLRDGVCPVNGLEVLVVRLNANRPSAPGEAGVTALERIIRIQKECGFRVVLISMECDPEWDQLLGRLGPATFTLSRSESTPVLDRTVHGLIEMASLHAEVRVSRLTEKAAFFLEESVKSKVDGELVALVVLGLRRSDGKVLRFRDLLPNFHRHFEGGDQGETV